MKKKIYSDYIIQKDSSGLKKYIADYEGMYKNCDDPHYQSNFNKLEIDFVVQTVKKVWRMSNLNSVIDVGCGLGFLSNHIFKELGNPKFFACDISETAISKASKKFKNINFFQFDLEKKCEIPPQLISLMGENRLVLLTNVFYYIHEEKLKQSFENIKSLIGKDGYAIFTIYLPKEQHLGKFIDGIDSATQLLEAYGFSTIMMTKIKNSIDKGDDENIPPTRTHIIFVGKLL